MINPMDLSSGLADAAAATRAAMRDRCGITVEPRYLKFARSQRNHWKFDVVQDGRLLDTFDDDDLAYAFADELASELIEQGDLECTNS